MDSDTVGYFGYLWHGLIGCEGALYGEVLLVLFWECPSDDTVDSWVVCGEFINVCKFDVDLCYFIWRVSGEFTKEMKRSVHIMMCAVCLSFFLST